MFAREAAAHDGADPIIAPGGDDALRIVIQILLTGLDISFYTADEVGRQLQLLDDLLVPFKELDGVPPLLGFGQARQAPDLCQGVLHRAAEPVDGCRCLSPGSGQSPLRRSPNALALDGGDLHHLTAQGLAQLLRVQAVAVPPDNIHHVHCRHHRNSQLQQLCGQIEVALQIRTVDDVQNHVRPLLDQVVPGHHLLECVGGEGVDAGQVCDRHIPVALQRALLLFHRYTGPVAHILAGPRQGVEQGGLAGVRVPGKGNSCAHTHISFHRKIISLY